MATVTLASTTFELEKCSNNNHEDYSFSSYLNLIRESLAHEFGDSSSATPATMRVSIGKRRTEKGELDIFSAEKYFNGLMDTNDARSENSSENTGKNLYKNQGRILSLKSRSGTESSCSEASANSRSTLLRDSRRKSGSGAELKKSSSSSKKFLGVFWCSCAGKDDIKADEENHQFPNHATEFLTERVVLGFRREGVAIGAFGSPFVEKPVIGGSSRRQSSSFLAPASGGGGGGGDNDDLHSESSSDLFEIDHNLNLSIHVHPLFNPEPAYEPSEASIEWSVATASGVNDDRRSETTKKATKNHKAAGLLSGCADNKAVSVHAHTYHDVFERPERVNSGHHDHHFGLQSLPPVARYHASQAIYTR